MATIKPFSAVRPMPGLEAQIAALPYDVYSREEAKEEVKDKPLSFLNIDRPETAFDSSVDMYSDLVYQRAKERFEEMLANGQYIKEAKPCYYLYRLVMNGKSQTGIVGCASVDDYINGTIRKHENTRADKEADRIRHVDTMNAQTGPIFLAYRSHAVLAACKAQIMQQRPVYDFVSADGVGHTVWTIDAAEDIRLIAEAFDEMHQIYIADGHHRCASAVKVSMKRRQENPSYTGEEPFQYFLSVLFSEEELSILDYNRVVKDLNGLTKEAFLERLSECFTVSRCETQKPYKPSRKGEFGMYFDGSWYCLTIQEGCLTKDVVADLDVSILQDHLLSPVLGITEPKTDKRIDFVGGIRGLSELERRCHTDCAVAFSMFPTTIQELFAVADAGRLMPPKSTWFEPKLRSGLFIHQI